MKKQNEKRLTILVKLCLLVVVLCVQTALFQQTKIDTYAQGKATVVASSGKIRESADTDSEVIASVKKGDKLDVITQSTDANGYTWYKVYVDGEKTGYIRADLVGDVTGTIKAENISNTDASSESDTDTKEEEAEPVQQQVQFVQVNASEAAAGKVVGASSVNVRENPSTSAAVAGKANEGIEVSILGEAVDSVGKIWYQVSFGNTKGFIRSDYVEVTQNVEEETTEAVTEEETENSVEEPSEEPIEESVNKEYEVIYEVNSEGIEEWFLYDHNRGTKQSLEDLLAVVRQTQEEEQGALSQLKTFKLLTIVLVAAVIVLIIIVTILAFKLRDAYEYEYDDEDEYEDDEDDEDDEDEEEEQVARKPVLKKASQPVSERFVEKEASVEEPINTPEVSAKQEAPSKDTSWQSKNFLDIDDDMEFEFLDLK